MGLKERLQADMLEAMRHGDARRRDTLRMLLAAVKQVEVDRSHSLSEEEVQNVLLKQAKQRHESMADYERAGRAELAATELAEAEIIDSYLSPMMSREEIAAAARLVIAELSASGDRAMGQVMGRLMPQLKGKAEGRLINEVVRELLQGR